MSPIRVAFCITDLEPGGAERCFVEIVTRLNRDRFQPSVYCLGPRPEEPRTVLVDRLEAAGHEVTFLGATSKRHISQAVRRLAASWREAPPNVVQTLLFHANIVGRMAARWAGVRHVVSGLRVAERGARWHRWCDWLTSRWVERYVCVSQSVARFSQTTGRLPASKLSVIPNGIDPALYQRVTPANLSAEGIPFGRIVMLYAGRLARQKGLDWLFDCLPGLVEAVPKAELLLAGDGPLAEPLREKAAALGLSERVHFLGFRDDVPRLLAAAKLLILPSRWEGMPNVVLEAMASGLPVLSSDVEGVRELLGPYAESQTVNFGDTPNFVDKATLLLSDRALATELGRANRQRATEAFSLAAMVSAYEDLWQHLTGVEAT